MKHSVTRTDSDDVYMYRGVRIERDDRARGYWGHWSARTGGKRLTTEKRAQLLAQIDEVLDTPQPVKEKTINMAQTWRALLPLLVEAAVNGDNEAARGAAWAELYRLADTVDKLNQEEGDE